MIVPQVQEVPLALLTKSQQIRQSSGCDKASIDALAQSIVEAGGIVQPIVVCRCNDDWEIVEGSRRVLAAPLAGLETVPALLLDHKPSKAELVELQLILNQQRVNFDPIELATAYRTLINDCGLTASAVAKKLNVSESSISRTLSLLILSETVQARIRSGELAPSTAYEIAKIADPVERDRLIAETVGQRLSRDRVAHRARRVHKPAARRTFRRTAADRIRFVIPLADSGCVSIPGPVTRGEGAADPSVDALVVWLTALIAKLKLSKGLGFVDALKTLTAGAPGGAPQSKPEGA